MRTCLTREIALNIPLLSARWTPSPSKSQDLPRANGGIGSCTNLPIAAQATSRQGQALRGGRSLTRSRCARAGNTRSARVMARYRSREYDHAGRQGGGDPHQRRPGFVREPTRALARDDEPGARHVPPADDGAPKELCTSIGREAAGRGRAREPARLIHQTSEERAFPARARRSGRLRCAPRWAWATRHPRARRMVPQASNGWWSKPRTATRRRAVRFAELRRLFPACRSWANVATAEGTEARSRPVCRR